MSRQNRDSRFIGATSPREAILAAARERLSADTAEEGFAEIRRRTGVPFADADLANAVAQAVEEGILRDPVRLEAGALHCFWKLEPS